MWSASTTPLERMVPRERLRLVPRERMAAQERPIPPAAARRAQKSLSGRPECWGARRSSHDAIQAGSTRERAADSAVRPLVRATATPDAIHR